MRPYRTRPTLVIIVLLMITVCAAALVLGQGGTGKEPTSSPTIKGVKKKTPAHVAPRPKPQPSTARQRPPQIELVSIPAGTFTMGSPESEVGRDNDEGPQHRVSIRSFSIGKYEVTQSQYREVMGTNPSYFSEAEPERSHYFGLFSLPVDSVSWDEAVEFCRKLSQMTGKQYRLPTEAEWEYACRAGTTTAFAFGDSLSSDQENFDGTLPYGGGAKGVNRSKTTRVGSFQPNGFGLYDMHGNVGEWCEGWYHESYDGAPTDGSAWVTGGHSPGRVVRGGAWLGGAIGLRSANRSVVLPRYGFYTLGFRVVEVARTQ